MESEPLLAQQGRLQTSLHDTWTPSVSVGMKSFRVMNLNMVFYMNSKQSD